MSRGNHGRDCSHPFPRHRPDPTEAAIERAVGIGTTFRDEDLSAWYCAALEHLYRVAARKSKAQAHLQHVTNYDKDGVDQFSLALGKVQMLEALCPEFFEAWISDRDPRRQRDPEGWSHARVVREAAQEDAKRELRDEVILMALATGEVAAPAEEKAA